MQNPGKGAFQRLFLLFTCLLPILAQADTACPAGQPDETARIRYVHDGDTVHLEDGRKVRLIGINTPELARDDSPAQAFAEEAREALIKAVSQHDNRIGLVYGKERFDRYKRTLAHLFSPDGDNLQAILLQQGMALAITHPPNTVYSECYAGHEKKARCSGRGLWTRNEQVIIRAADLDTATTGFHLISGEVELVSQTGKGVWLYMAELVIGIRHQDFDYFDLPAMLALEGKTITVRGWLHPAGGRQFRNGRTVKYYLRLRHPSGLEIIPAGHETEC